MTMTLILVTLSLICSILSIIINQRTQTKYKKFRAVQLELLELLKTKEDAAARRHGEKNR